MKKIIALIITLCATSTFAINEHQTFGNMGYMIRSIVAPVGSFSTADEAIEGAKELASELQSGKLSRDVKRALRNSNPLWDTDKKCLSLTDGSAWGKTVKAMSKGRFGVRDLGLRGGTQVSSDFEIYEAYGFSMNVYVPCVLR